MKSLYLIILVISSIAYASAVSGVDDNNDGKPDLDDFQYLGKRNWTSARDLCEKHENKMILLEIHSFDENEAFKEFLKECKLDVGHHEYWLGAQRKSQNSALYWMSNDEEISYRRFAKNEPNNLEGRENCLAVVANGLATEWADDDCSEEKHVICLDKSSGNINHSSLIYVFITLLIAKFML